MVESALEQGAYVEARPGVSSVSIVFLSSRSSGSIYRTDSLA